MFLTFGYSNNTVVYTFVYKSFVCVIYFFFYDLCCNELSRKGIVNSRVYILKKFSQRFIREHIWECSSQVGKVVKCDVCMFPPGVIVVRGIWKTRHHAWPEVSAQYVLAIIILPSHLLNSILVQLLSIVLVSFLLIFQLQPVTLWSVSTQGWKKPGSVGDIGRHQLSEGGIGSFTSWSLAMRTGLVFDKLTWCIS